MRVALFFVEGAARLFSFLERKNRGSVGSFFCVEVKVGVGSP
ncbi:hypothetical protein HD598_002100 [Neomicrococcus aestuarii]|uniref:Uncharacterized protein n=1 Tax=Neomicrococcus aestuarii TaxID=556325 RepID=A0A7W8TV84_9MICC|nr:hypothetical protein [Neomicrococcus aestuarii]